MHNFTHNDFIRHFHNESSQEEAVAIKALLKTDEEFERLYEEIGLPVSYLIDLKKEPNQLTISKIIHYANKVNTKIHLN
ncbi:MAG: hypothetical protein NVSMB45_09880 [Ginsengibacter sp.]